MAHETTGGKSVLRFGGGGEDIGKVFSGRQCDCSHTYSVSGGRHVEIGVTYNKKEKIGAIDNKTRNQDGANANECDKIKLGEALGKHGEGTFPPLKLSHVSLGRVAKQRDYVAPHATHPPFWDV